jgi:hypothetical protein
MYNRATEVGKAHPEVHAVPEGTPLITFRAGHLLEHLTPRGHPLAAVAKRDLTRYYLFLLLQEGSLPDFTSEELDAIEELVRHVEPFAPGLTIPTPSDAQLARKLDNLTVGQWTALVDKLERRRYSLARLHDMARWRCPPR